MPQTIFTIAANGIKPSGVYSQGTFSENIIKGENMAGDKLEKGAILQRDKETYAIAPQIPG
ncbi:MAG TPA: hypothetical protein PKC27_10705, partial [Methanomethylovorans sp.]|nr:hypothetical protein [Methanomethylovorans sp.]